ncbi:MULTISPECIES: amino acid ABC transporter substrate-binding protein [unclassified Fusibacter]|uniref:amino acid ABC transporter substrate-binding protein n=1 Tax=unclassified Fusibacter TaxID=2624464 RepID=UPI0010123E41|nr:MULTISPECIES: amino acid ABC transporter substrate-binding protein [unclassified Fusibacter]MCK8061585.1 amino acid ABC transporter substrate-binding protein [Fusibacter sp. A2]NPE23768.1 amino acid ABC transporter substrate-binding protein [Fusibacter sp. A1]RXV58674.1 amino acid ABC transporter substrate-binding protein [Fusibacter sp. A1]
MKRNLLKLTITMLVLTLGLTACTTGKVDTEVGTLSNGDKPIVKVGMSGGYKPYTFIDQNGELTGFDVAVWNAIGERIGAQIVFETSEFSGLFGKLDNSQLTTIANQITITDERKEKYLFSVPYVYYGAQLVVHSDNEDIVDLSSLIGKKVGVSLGSNYETIIREYDVENEIEIITYEDYQASLRDVSLGRIDAVLNDKLAGLTAVTESGLDIKLGGEPVSELFNAFPFIKTDDSQALLLQVNEVIESLKSDGTLSSISLEWFPIDITQE